MADAEATFNLAVSKGGTPPSGRTLEALHAWCVARGGAPARNAVAVQAFVAAFGAGFVQYTTPGTYSFVVPAHASLSVSVTGAGGGGGGVTAAGGTASATQFGSVVASGGAGGADMAAGGANGAAGGASGGAVNTPGGGNPGGVGAWSRFFDKNGDVDQYGGQGGAGGFASRSYTPATLTVGSSVTVVVAAGGAAGAPEGNQRAPAAGAGGSVVIAWS